MKKKTNPLPEHALSPALQKRINQEIELLKAIESKSPSVIIVHLLGAEPSVLYMSQRGLDILGVTMQELKGMGAEYHPRFFNMEFAESYVPRIFALLDRNNNDEVVSFVQQVRSSPDQEWIWFLSCTRIFLRDEEGRPLLILTNSIQLDTQFFIDPAKANRLMEENNFLRKNYQHFNKLTKREREVLRLLALGHSSSRIAKKLFLSEQTANTHRRNIKRKLKVESNYDIIRFAQAFDLI